MNQKLINTALLFTTIFSAVNATAETHRIRLPEDARDIQVVSMLKGKVAIRNHSVPSTNCNSFLDDSYLSCPNKTIAETAEALVLTVTYKSNQKAHSVYDVGQDRYIRTNVIEEKLYFNPAILNQLATLSSKSLRYGKDNKALIAQLFSMSDQTDVVPAWIVDEQKSVRCDYDSEANKIDRNCSAKIIYKKDPTGATVGRRYFVVSTK